MFELITDAINRQDYSTAHQLLQELDREEPDNPWNEFYKARLQELEGNLAAANEGYHQLLTQALNPKLIVQIRQGIERINQQEDGELQKVLNQAMEAKDSQQRGMLILEAIPQELKQVAAQKFGKIMKIDPYTARLQLPSRSWRLYRIGAVGKLRFYAQQLQKAGIPCFTALLEDIIPIKVYHVLYIESVHPEVTVIYQPQKGQRDILTFNWAQVSQLVEGMLPIFEECMETGLKGKLQRKTQILDYAKFWDLHLPEQKSIIRFCDQTYHFLEGMSFCETQQVTDGRGTAHDSWVHLIDFIKQKLPNRHVWSEFNPFAESAIDFQELLKSIPSHIDLLRIEDTPWDAAFQLYSGLAFIKGISRS